MNMSVKNDIIALNEVVKQTTDLLREQSTSWKSIVDEIKKINQSAPSSYIKMQKDLADSIAKAEQVEQKYQATLSKRKTLQDKVRASMGDEERQLKANYQQQERVLNQQARWNAQMQKAENTYQRVQARVNQLTQTYNDLATRQALGQKLDTQQLATLAKLEGQLLAYDKILKQVDATVGKNQRNVGNYRSGFDGLGNSINQITRELPAFTFSAQTGFLALSNNIPILADEIQRVSTNVKEMRAQGQQVPGVMSQILSSFLSWQTVLSLAVTLITVYGKEIGEWISKTFKAKEAIDWLAKGKEEFNKITQDGRKNAQQEIIELNNYIKVAQNANLSTNERVKSANKLKETYPEYFKNMTTDQIMTADLTKIQNDLTTALIARATAIASISKMTENATKILDLEEENRLANENVLLLKERVKGQQELFNEQVKTGKANVYATQANKTYSEIEETQTAIRERMEEIVNLQIRNAKLAKTAETNTAKSANLETTTTPKTGKEAKDLLTAQYEAEKAKLELQKESSRIADEISAKEIQIATLTRNYKKQLVDLEVKDKATATQQKIAIENEYAKEVAKITEKMADDYGDEFTEQYKEVVKHVEDVTKAFEGTTKSIDETIQKGRELKVSLSDLDNQIAIESLGGNRGSKYWETRTQQLEDWYENQKNLHQDNAHKLALIDKEYELQNIQLLNDRKNAFKQAMTEMYSSALGEFGAGSLAQFFNGQFEEIWAGADELEEKMAAVMMAIGQIANDVFNAMSERQNAYYERQFANLEKERDLAIGFAGESTAGREAIEKQYEEKKVALQREQAKKQKQMAIFSAIINIAQGITASLAQGGPAGIILAALVGVLGAVQIASIASTPLPAFERGTQNAPEGWAITQEKGAEMITDKNGNIKTLGNNKGNQLTYLNKGDKVYTADETTQRINEMLLGTGVAPIVNTNVNSGLTEEQLERVMNKTLSKQPQNSIIFDEHGIRAYQNRENSRTKLKNRNVKL